jgi:hypothetical protein
MKGKISQNLENILRDEQGRRLLRRSLMTGKDGEITVGSVKYKVSTKNIGRSSSAGKFISSKTAGSSKRAAG